MVKLKPLLLLYFVACLIRTITYVSIVSIDSFYSTLKVLMKQFDINQRKAAFQDNKS